MIEISKRFFHIVGFLGVALGAFGSHGIKNKVTAEDFEIWKTAALYLFIHTLAGLHAVSNKNVGAARAFAFGILVFSGSLFTLVISGERWLGAVTPLGGVGFMVGWVLLAKRSTSENIGEKS